MKNCMKYTSCRDIVAALNDCLKKKDLYTGNKIHQHVFKKGLLERNPHLGTTLINMYAKCGALTKAQEVFDSLCDPDVVSWTALIAGYAHQGLGKEALNYFQQMRSVGIDPNVVTFISTLKACGNAHDLAKGIELHDQIVTKGLMGKNIMLDTALVDMYAKCGAFGKAKQMLDELPVRDVVSWNALISGYAQQSNLEDALRCLYQMKSEALSPDAVTFMSILKACGSTRSVTKGKLIHDEIVSNGFLASNIKVGNALVDMYVRCGELSKAKQIHEELPVRDVVSWTTIIAGCVHHGESDDAINCFSKMQNEGIYPNIVTFICILKAYGSTNNIDKGKEIHDEIVRKELLGKDVVLGNALADMYAKCGDLAKAEKVLNDLPIRDSTSWTTLIAGYVKQGDYEEALNCFKRMQMDHLSPDTITYVCLLKACGSMVDSDRGKLIHDEIVNNGFLEKDIVLGNALIDMYIRCGLLEKAEQVLEDIRVRDSVSWTALITAYAQHGQAEEALKCFELMQNEGLSPNSITFLCVLNACSHNGLVDEGEIYFDDMNKTYGISPSLDHCACMVDLYGRAGNFKKAISVINKLSSSDYLPVWSALLGACQKWGNVKLGRLAFERILRLDIRNSAAYVLMINIYAAAGMFKDVAKVELMRVKSWEQLKM